MSVDLTTRYLGLALAHPIMPGASPLADDLDTVRRLEDAGAPAIIMRSLFEERVVADQMSAFRHLDQPSYAFSEALTYFPETRVFAEGPAEYLEHLARIRATVAIPIIASLNGTTPGGWVEYAGFIQDAGAEALELNLYRPVTNPEEDSQSVEREAREIVRAVAEQVTIPIAVKLSPFYSALPHFVRGLEAAGAAGVILFNRFYQPDVNLEALEVERTLELSTPSELTLRLHALALLAHRTGLSLAAGGGIHSGTDAVKAVLCGAHGVQVVSTLLRHGPDRLRTLVREFREWLETHEYASVTQARGSLSLDRCPDPLAYERANYVRLLQGFHLPAWPDG